MKTTHDTDDDMTDNVKSLLIGRTIVDVTSPRDFCERNCQHLILHLDDGTQVSVSGQGVETSAVSLVISTPDALTGGES